MPKETFWFKHDYNARSDRRMMNLLMTTGVTGVGIYWCVIEMLYEEGGYLMLSECERIAFELRTDCDLVAKVVRSSLFACDDEKFWSESVLRRLGERHEKSEKAKKSADIRWRKPVNCEKDDANAMRTHSDGNASGMLKRREEKRRDSSLLYLEEVSKEVESKEEIQEVKIEVKAETKKKEAAVADNDFPLYLYGVNDLEPNLTKTREVYIVQELIKIWKLHYPEDFIDKQKDLPAALEIAYKIADKQGWKRESVLHENLTPCCEYWAKMILSVKQTGWQSDWTICTVRNNFSKVVKQLNNATNPNYTSTTTHVPKRTRADALKDW